MLLAKLAMLIIVMLQCIQSRYSLVFGCLFELHPKTSHMQCNSVKGQVCMHPCMFFRMLEICQQVTQHQSLGTIHDNLQAFYS